MKDKEPPQDFLDWMGVKAAPNWAAARLFGPLLSVILSVLFAMALAASFALLLRTFVGSPISPGGSLGTGALIVAILGAPFLIWSTVLKHQTVRYQKEGHITDRINKAVEQLGMEKSVKRDGKETTEPNIEVRIGAILSLERIAQDSTRYDKGRDHVRVMEILCAYVRENSNATPPRDFPLPEWEPLRGGATEEERAAHLQKCEERFGDNLLEPKTREWARALPKPRADITQALKVLGRRTAEQRRVEAAWPNPPEKETTWPFDLSCPKLLEVDSYTVRTEAEINGFKEKLEAWSEHLRNYSGYRLDLRGANLQGADLSANRPDASNSIFAGALLKGVRIEGANLWKARMEGTDFRKARMDGANLREACMEAANLSEARMEGANFRMVRMEGAHLSWARMEGADLRKARMSGADLSWLVLVFADLRGAQLEGANLKGARMEGADLRKSSLIGADLRLAQMEGTELGGLPLDSEVIF